MYRFVILCVAIIAVSADDENMHKCRHLMHPGLMRCCNKLPKDYIMDAELKECFMSPRGPASCARDICIAKKKGFATDDDKLDVQKFEEVFKKDFEGESDLIDAVTKNCINGNLQMYGPPDFCDITKMRNCLSKQIIIQCPDWSEKDECKGTKELVEECTKIFS